MTIQQLTEGHKVASPSGMRLRTDSCSSSSCAMEWRNARRHLAGGHSHRLAACRRQVWRLHVMQARTMIPCVTS